MSLVLASTSRYRAGLLRRLGHPFVQLDPELDEAPWHARDLPAVQLVSELARAKAERAAERADCPADARIIGSDQTAELDGALLHKPGTPERAVAQLLRLSGREHRLWTAVALLDRTTGACRLHVDLCRLIMRPFDAATARAYVERWQPLDCAGSYRIEDAGIALFERVVGDDPTAIEGLPLMWLGGVLG